MIGTRRVIRAMRKHGEHMGSEAIARVLKEPVSTVIMILKELDQAGMAYHQSFDNSWSLTPDVRG